MGPLRRAMYSGMDTLGHWLFQGEEDVEGAAGQGQEEVRRGMCWGLTDSRIWNLLWCYTQRKTCSSTNEAPELRIKGFLGCCLRTHGIPVLSRASVCGCQSKPLSFSAQWQHENKWHTEKRDGRKTSEIEQDSGELFFDPMGLLAGRQRLGLRSKNLISMLQRARMRSSAGHVRASALSRHGNAFSDAWKLLKDFQWLPTTPRLTRLHLRLLYFDLKLCLTVYWFGCILFSPVVTVWPGWSPTQQPLHGVLWIPSALYVCLLDWAQTGCGHLVPFVMEPLIQNSLMCKLQANQPRC